MFGPAGLSSFSKAVAELISLIHSTSPNQDSLYEQAMTYFVEKQSDDDRLALVTEKRDALLKQLETADKKEHKEIKSKFDFAEKNLKDLIKMQTEKRNARYDATREICIKIIKLSEAEDEADTLVQSAKILGTILLSSPGEGRKLAPMHQRSKPLYKAILAVRLLDKLLDEGQITNKYILQYCDTERFPEDPDKLTPFQEEVAIPLMMAAIFQDVGMFHPDARKVLLGEDGKQDEFRLLEGEDRMTLLKLNHVHALDYITNGLGMRPYRGNSREEKAEFEEQQKNVLTFVRTVLNDAIKPKQGLGNLIKAPQIYASVILSTKAGYDIRELPKAAMLLEQVAKRGAISEAAANSLVSLVGYFPQGFGITYIPKDDLNEYLDRYEFAIVNGLNPDHPKVPRCRLVTRNLEFVAFGNNAQISVESNLYFPKVQKKLQKMSKERLREILSKLSHDFEMRCEMDLIPKTWEPYDYFSFRNNQNLWNRKISKLI